ncbi:MAG: hypothetical protein HOW73_05685 [Polyangiaceae bacterium]|nr:hypothetical protein [Polyangiaceae bacterium]
MSAFTTTTSKLGILAGLAVASAVATAGVGCDTQAFCFNDCGEGASTATLMGGSGGEAGSTGEFQGGSTGQFTTGGGGEGGGGPCDETNGGIEICDDVDNDCNGVVDDIEDIDYDDPKSCGTCANNCYTLLLNIDPATITCTPSDMPGEEPGTCDGDCAQDYHDLDGDGQSCEYYCVASGANDSVCDNKDDDCDGAIDEDVNLCDDEQNCGKCGGICVVGNGTPICVHTGADPNCTQLNTHCEIGACNPGWVDLDGSYATGCEYQCTPTGVEVCGDQLDNDCDGLIDAADDLSGDPNIGVSCFGDPDGVCGEVAHEGTTACLNGVVTCMGPDVLFENDQLEMCNGDDDDCDGIADDSPTDAGNPCGTSNIFPCTFGTQQCQNGSLVCVGAINPGTETCNGQDDNCDGSIDLVNGMPPMDSMGSCNVPVPPPPGATSPCTAGTKACLGGTVQCVGSTGPSGPTDTCGVDANCDGALTNQPNTANDPAHCGSCSNNCNANQPSNHASFTCVNSTCTFQACLPGYYDLDNNGTCEYQCTFISAQEACNGDDDDCDGQIDEGVVAPSPKQVCGVSPAASRPECTTNVNVQCVNGDWACTFPAGVCSPSCAMATETCDGLDNDCDGLFNENVPDFGQACASDDGIALKHGACRTFGTRVCNGGAATTCSAMKADCNTLPGGCTEQCDGVDNDCDGTTDEPYTAKGTNVANFYKPKVIQIAANTWIYQQEASRPNSTSTAPGSGNGYWTSSPPGETLDETPSCSEGNRIPWFNVTPLEAEQTCQAAGGQLCSTTLWRNACHVTPISGNDCLFGYGPDGTACRSVATASKFCNIGPSYDFNSGVAGDQDGLLPTQFLLGNSCYSPWQGLQNNPNNDSGRLFDITGNLREITKTNATTYTLMGGAFNTQAENGASCDFTFYAVDDEYKFFDTGFRCCFTTNPTL